MLDKILDIIDKLGGLFYVLVPAIYIAYHKVSTKIKGTIEAEKQKDISRNKNLYDIWEHEESKQVIYRIKNLCNLYKDRGHADLVQYLQLENGTMATSKIQNMFVTCLAEDDRFGSIPKMIRKLQRLPYSETVCWLSKLSDNQVVLKTPDLSKTDFSRTYVEDLKTVKSVMASPVYDPNEILLGVCLFYYHDKNFNNQEESEADFLHKFSSSVESILLEYHQHRNDKKKQLKLEDELHD